MKTELDINDIWDALEARDVWRSVEEARTAQAEAEREKRKRLQEKLAEVGGRR